MDGHGEVRRNEQPCRMKIYMPENETKAIGEMIACFEVDLGCLVRHSAPNWGNQSWNNIPTNQKEALFKKLEVVYFYILRFHFAFFPLILIGKC